MRKVSNKGLESDKMSAHPSLAVSAKAFKHLGASTLCAKAFKYLGPSMLSCHQGCNCCVVNMYITACCDRAVQGCTLPCILTACVPCSNVVMLVARFRQRSSQPVGGFAHPKILLDAVLHGQPMGNLNGHLSQNFCAGK